MPETLTRSQAIDRLRGELIQMTDEDSCACKVAAERGIFCHGFNRYDDQNLRERYWWIVRRRPNLSREELEKIANDWQLAQQDVQGVPVACDVQTRVHDTCGGWDDFSNDELAKFYEQITGRAITIQ